jgi:hypothetical protein
MVNLSINIYSPWQIFFQQTQINFLKIVKYDFLRIMSIENFDKRHKNFIPSLQERIGEKTVSPANSYETKNPLVGLFRIVRVTPANF